MKYYTIQNNGIAIAENEETLKRYYDNVYELPEDYEDDKYIIGEAEKEIDVPDYETKTDEEGNEYQVQTSTHKKTIIVRDIVLNPDYEEILARKEQERISKLTCTKRVFALILQEKGVGYKILKELISSNEQAQLEWDLCEKLERSNPLLDIMAKKLNYTSKDIDEIFIRANM